MAGKLFFVGTPIGNLKDMSHRAIETLNSVEVILCEDTRHSLKLLNSFNIKKKLLAFHKFNYKQMTPKVIDILMSGKDIALITDAGMPGISDPGSELIEELTQNQISYTVVPGACAFVSAFVLSGLSSPFTFVGFLPDNKKDRKTLLQSIKDLQTTLIFYIAPHSLNKDLEDLYKALGERKAVSVRELTKIHEEVERFNLSEGYLKEPKGEYVVLIEGASTKAQTYDDLSVEEHFNMYLKQGITKQEAIKQVAKDRGVPKQEIYKHFV